MTTNQKSSLDHDQLRQLTAFRRHLHAHPEVSGQEQGTARLVVDFLQKRNPDLLLEGLGGTGVAAVFDSKKPGKTVLFRAELDALPIQEVNDFAHRSLTNGVSHKCGHDGHMTILLGLAEVLAAKRPNTGRVVLLFQPAEETGVGAEAVLQDENFLKIKPDFVFAFHNLPGYPLNQIVVKDKAFTAAVKSIEVRLHGKTAHAAEPEHGQNPALAIAEILSQTNELSNNDPQREDFAVITPVHLSLGDISYGVSAGYGEVRLTLRTWTQTELEKLEMLVLHIVNAAAKRHQLTPETAWLHVFYANENAPEAVQRVRNAAAGNGFSLAERRTPFKWGEDFGLFTQRFPGALFGIGSGENSPALHNPDYDFPDDMIPVGVAMFHQISQQILD